MVSANYSGYRRAMAKQIGLGRKITKAEPVPAKAKRAHRKPKAPPAG